MPNLLCLRYGSSDIPLAKGSFMIGRSPECGIVFTSHRVSRRHARVSVGGDGVFVEDLGSRNGTFVNGTRVQGRMRIEVGNHLILASRSLQLIAKESAEPDGARQQRADSWFPESGSEPSSERMDDEVADNSATRQEDALTLVGIIAEKMFALGKTQEAELVMAPRLKNLLSQATSGRVAPSQAESAARQAIMVARSAKKAEWVEYVFTLYAATGDVLPATLVEELHAVVRKVPPIRVEALRDYIAVLDRKAAELGPRDKFVVNRIKGLDALALSR